MIFPGACTSEKSLISPQTCEKPDSFESGFFVRCSGLQPFHSKGSPFRMTYSAFCALTLMPGPMVVAVTQLRMYWPLAAAGFAFTMAPIRAS